jgi:hypothetical protein
MQIHACTIYCIGNEMAVFAILGQAKGLDAKLPMTF